MITVVVVSQSEVYLSVSLSVRGPGSQDYGSWSPVTWS